jgi:hypothetical protein
MQLRPNTLRHDPLDPHELPVPDERDVDGPGRRRRGGCRHRADTGDESEEDDETRGHVERVRVQRLPQNACKTTVLKNA